MAFKLRAVTDTHALADDQIQRRYLYLYVDKSTGKTMTRLAPLYDSDDVEGDLRNKPTREHVERGGQIRVVTTWTRQKAHPIHSADTPPTNQSH